MFSWASPFNPNKYIGEVWIVTWSKSNPVCSLRSLITLSDNSEAVATSTTDNATWIGTSILPAICLLPPAVVLDFITIPGSVRAARHAGNVPNKSVVNTANMAVNQKTALSGCTEIGSIIIGSLKKRSSKPLPYHAPTAPSALPTIAITKLSVSDCRTSRTGHHQTANVHAAYEQHNSHQALHQKERSCVSMGQIVRQTASRRTQRQIRLLEKWVVAEALRNKLRKQAFLHLRQFGFGLAERKARLQPSDGRNTKKRFRRFEYILLPEHRSKLQRQIHLWIFARPHSLKFRGRYSYDGHWHIGNSDLLAQNVFCGSIKILPEAVAEHHGPATARAPAYVVISSEQPSAVRLDSQHSKCVSTHQSCHVSLDRTLVVPHEHPIGAPCGELPKRRLLLPHRLHHPVRHIFAGIVGLGFAGNPHLHQLPCVGRRQAPQHQPIQQCENRAVRPDSERER